MIKIGGAWEKTAQESKKQYLSVSVAKELLPLTLTNERFLTLHINENKTEENHPDYILCLSVAEKNNS